MATVKRLTLGKLFHYFNQLSRPLSAVATGGTMAAETAAGGGTLEQTAEAAGAGIAFSQMGNGRIGIKEIKDLRTGERDYKVVIRSDADIAADKAKEEVKVEKAKEAKAKEQEKAQKVAEETGKPAEKEPSYDEFIKTYTGEDVGAAKARKETKLYGKLLEQQGDIKAKIDEFIDPNLTKVGSLVHNVDKRIDEMVSTAEKMSRAAYEAGDKVGAIRAHQEAQEIKKIDEQIKRRFEEIKQETNTIVSRLKRSANMQSIDADYRDQINSKLEDYDLHKRSKETLEKREDLKAFIKDQELKGETIYIPEEKLDMLRKVPLNDMSLAELRNLDDVVGRLVHLGKLKKKLIRAGRERDLRKRRVRCLEVSRTTLSTIRNRQT